MQIAHCPLADSEGPPGSPGRIQRLTAPDFEGKSAILAITENGQPLPPEDGIRLIVPGDKHGGRAVRDVVKIDIQ
jgi:DMSO/TMAO reductase YedYZ molybdopterin-dependent catalytic subunit